MIFRSKCPTLPIPDDASIWKVVEEHATTIGDKPAFICGLTDRTLTFAELLRQAQQVCAGLAAHSLTKGDVVILHSFNCLEYVVVFLALNRLGAICSPSSPLFKGKELANQIKTAQAVAIISHKKLVNVAVEAAGLRGIPLAQVYTLGEEGAPSGGLQSIEDLMALDLPLPNIPRIDTNQLVTLPFSSGTTGRPKGVELTARAMYASGMIPAHRESKTQPVLGMLPFFHIMMTMNFHVTLYLGKAMIVLPGFKAETFLRTVEKYKLDMINLAPPLVTFLAKHPIVGNYDLSHVKHVKSGGAPLGKEVERAVMQRLGIQVLQGYGMTEFVGCGCRAYPNIVRDGSSGTLHPNTELRVRDLETGEDLPANKTGELLFRTPTLMNGYHNNLEATRAAFTEDGFLRTGDLGYIDDDGYIFIVDRLKELIKYKGHQVAPAEVEDVVNSHPLVLDSCCVRGRDWKTGEEIPKAFVVLKEGERLTGEALEIYVASKVTYYKRVREVEFTDVIPKSLSGKILRRELQRVQDKDVELQRAQQSRL
ncbi:4-coumarate--CoA ligase [Phytophthora ramorum]|uniref:4-coumarate--CoA ligase n=1 Tax=Phytophthora ramorum TaxID=164328 RepID=UPI0030B6DA71|nr:4-coumarate--CoA ligase [Phytophthora ramorum]